MIKKVIRLTESGRAYGDGVVMHIYEAEQRAVEKLSPQERQFCTELLSKYIMLLREEL